VTTTTPAPANTRRYRVSNPATGELVQDFASATDEEIQAALTAANSAFTSWRSVPIQERARIVSRIGELFLERADYLAGIITEEMGKPRASGKGEVKFSRDIFEYYAVEGPGLAADLPIKTKAGGQALVQKLPIGALLGIMPWNYPYYQVARFVAPNLMLGNTIILKHAVNCPRSALAIQEIMDDAGLPKGAYINVFATHQQIAEIIADPRVQGVSLTGSEAAGAKVAEIAGRHLKKVVLELGGSDPYIILDSNDPKASARAAFATRMANTGQACNSNKRIIVMETIHEEFVQELTRLASQLVPGDPSAGTEGTFAPMATKESAEELYEIVSDAVEKGAKLHVGGRIAPGPGAYFEPAVITGVTKEMRAYGEELFGPVAVVYKVTTEDEAVALANDSEYGLSGVVFSTDEAKARAVAERLDCGMASVNSAGGDSADLPFGGIKRSGYGRELGPLGMDEFMNKRLLYIAPATDA
jgi:succinate-semialdehyde dehydrogenase / glutarate-semialdehyde dehydrogenase